jgi:hypothetical protein
MTGAKDDKPKTPKPRTVKVVCDVCGMDWKAHGPKPTARSRHSKPASGYSRPNSRNVLRTSGR